MNSAEHGGFWQKMWTEIKPLLVLSEHKRPLSFILTVAFCIGLPAFFGAWFGQLPLAMLACMGAIVAVYTRQTPIPYRMMTLATCSFGFIVSFAVGVLSSFDPYFSAFTLLLTVFFVTLVCRYFVVPPPGTFFFIVVACLARTLPFDLSLVAQRTGMLAFGCIGACSLVLFYSLIQAKFVKIPPSLPTATDQRIVAICLEAALIALFVGGGYFIALLCELHNPYWVPISTAAIMQGATFRAVWHRNVHRIAGTIVGMGLAWLIFSYSPNDWVFAGLILGLSFVIEVLVTRNYGLAVIFITPLTLIFADVAMATIEANQLILARVFDIILGSLLGYIGGWFIYHPKLFKQLERILTHRNPA